MDTTILVESDIVNGRLLVEALDRLQFECNGALWFQYATKDWHFLLVSSWVDTKGPKKCYELIQSAINEIEEVHRIPLERISVLSPNDRLVRILKMAIRTGQGMSQIRFARNTINGVFIEDALIYRLY
jgi:hypothetical protein